MSGMRRTVSRPRAAAAQLALGVFWWALAGCSGGDDRPAPIQRSRGADQPELPDLPETADSFTERACPWFPFGYATQCGVVTVPTQSEGTHTLEIEVLRVFSKHPNRQPDPIVYLDGGPGLAGISTVLGGFQLFEPLLAKRDLVVLDQRGTGRSGEALDCPETYEVETAREFIDALGDCAERLRTAGIDLASYTTKTSAADVDAVRLALGYPEWNLLGISYGTRLGLTVLRDHPTGVRSAVLDSVVPLEVDLIAQVARNSLAAFDVVFMACEGQPHCAEHYPSPRAQLLSLIPRLNEAPLELVALSLTGDVLLNLLFNLMYHPAGVALVPWLIDQADRGESTTFDVLLDALSGTGDVEQGMSFGLHLSVQCAEEIPFTSRERVAEEEAHVPQELIGGLSAARYFDYCDAWRVPAAHHRENEPVSSDIPTLLLAGGFDPITPPSYAQKVHENLERSLFVTLDQLSHGAALDPCGVELLGQFYDAPGSALDTGCGARVPAPEFQSFQENQARRVTLLEPSLRFATDAPSESELAALARRLRKWPHPIGHPELRTKPRRPGSEW